MDRYCFNWGVGDTRQQGTLWTECMFPTCSGLHFVILTLLV